MRELSLNILDVAQNSISAGASLIEIFLDQQPGRALLTIEISDNGCGMNEEQIRKVTDPFYTTRTTRNIGMGVPLFKMAAEMTGGSFSILSEPGRGTAVKAVFRTDHMDFTPVGDICSTMVSLIGMNPDRDFIYRETHGEESFALDTREIREMLGDVSLSEPEVTQWLTEYLKEQSHRIHGGADHENA